MRTSSSDIDRFRWIAIALVIVVVIASALVAFITGRATNSRIRDQLSERSQTIAAALGPNTIAKLAGQPADANTTTYKNLKQSLASIKRANPDARSIYIMGQHGGRLFFFVDSEQPDSRDYSSAAEWYDDSTEADKAIFQNGSPLVEGPVTDSYGTFISGLAPIFAPSDGSVLAVLGIDVGADTYWRDIAAAVAVPVLAGFSIIMVIAIFERQRQRNLQLMAVRSELMSVASHELRTPLTGIRWAAESIQALIKDDKVEGIAQAIRNSATSMQASIEDILELSKVMNHRGLAIATTDLTKLVRDVIDAQSLSAQQRTVTVTLDPSWPAQLNVECDPVQIKRALFNVIGNAVKYTPEGSIVTVTYEDTPNAHRINIIDHGIGIPAKEQGKIFKGFYRASNAVASKTQGSGLGLYLVKAVMERHGGGVSFVSEENKGTTFTLSLPKKK